MRAVLPVVAAGCLAAVLGCGGSSTAPQPQPPAEPPAGPPLFDDVTAASGVAATYKNGEDAGHFAIIESLGGGAALLDYDGDGRLDIFFPGGGHYQGQTVLGHPCRLFRNLGGFKFEDVTAKTGLDQVSFPYSHGAAAFDYDRDGRTDLLVTGYSRLVLLRNDGGRFTDVTAKAGLTDKLWSASAGWGDLDGDGFPEIYVTHYGDWGFDTNHPTDCTYDGKTRDVCQPRRFKALPHTVYRNQGNGTFTDISAKLNLRTDGKGLGVLVTDFNNDGRPDVYVANDTDDNFLYLNRGKAGAAVELKEVGLFAGVARDDRGSANGSMGVCGADFNRTGLASVIVTNYENELPALYRNRSDKLKEQFTYDTLPAGLAVVGGSYVSWGTAFLDYDLDGWEDLTIVSGHAIRFPTKIDRRQTPLLLRNEAGKFRPTTAAGGGYFRIPHNARGLAVGDLDDDGRPDLVVSHLNEPAAVLRNVAPVEGKHWLGVSLAGATGRDVVGARVVVESAGGVQTKFVKGGGSYASTSDPRLLFGLGADAAVSRVTVHWPAGTAEEFAGLAPGAYWVLPEGGPARRR